MEFCNIEFWDHQIKMFQICKSIELKSKFCVLADPPGSGKTLVMLGIIANSIEISRNELRPNLLVVSENIYNQWIESIKLFPNITYKKFIEYPDITRLYFDISSILDYDILITTPLYYNIIVQCISNKNLGCYRVIFDEIDSVKNLLKEKIKSNYTWIISGTFNQSIIPELRNVIKIDKKIEIKNSICKLEQSEYKVLEKLEKPNYQEIICKDVYLDKILASFKDDIFSKKELDRLNALDYKGFNALVGINQQINNLKNITEEFISKQRKLKEETIINIENTKKEIILHKKELESLKLKDELSGDEKDRFDFLNRNLDSLTYSEKNLKYKLEEATMKYDKIMNRIKEEKMCMICYSEMDDNFIATDCCHSVYCESCIKLCLQSKSNCPFCKTNLKKSDDFVVIDVNNNLRFEKYKLYYINKSNKDDNIMNIVVNDGDYEKTKSQVFEEISRVTLNFTNASKLSEFISENISNKIPIEFLSKLKKDISKFIYSKFKQNILTTQKNIKDNEYFLNNVDNMIEQLNNDIINTQNTFKREKKELDEKKCIEIDKMKHSIGNHLKNSKMEELKFLINNIHKSEKAIIFSSHNNVFNEIIKYLEEINIGYIEIDTTDIDLISNSINKFKTDENYKIMMTNSFMNGAGLNLEFVDIIIIMHKMPDDLKKQLIARAQRPGRVDQLEIYQLLHLNEKN